MMFSSFRRLLQHHHHYARARARALAPYRCISSSRLTITKTTDQQRQKQKPPKEDLTFGTTLSDHMLSISFREGEWQAPEIKPLENLSISPAASALQYGLSCFEGMKAYKNSNDTDTDDDDDNDNTIRLFRPDKNMERLSRSMERLQMPGYDFDHVALLSCLKELLKLDKQWIPQGDGYSLYIRPTVIATGPYLGLAAPTELLLTVITSPVGPYYPSGAFTPITLLATSDYIRAWPHGGTGQYKIGGNYAPTMKPQAEAVAQGCSQVLWLFGDEITEVGSMNIFFIFENSDGDGDVLVTPPLDRGDILPGVTRDSILQLAHASGLTVEERFPTMTELLGNNPPKEAFGAGTAAVVTPIDGILYQGNKINIPATGQWTQRFWDELTGIQYGKIEGPDGWSVVV